MEILNIPPTSATPEIDFNATTGVFVLKGRSTHENPLIFYEPVLGWVDDYIKAPRPHTILHINLHYFNTTSSKCLLDLMKKMKELTTSGNSVALKWYYEQGDEDMEEAGEDYATLLDIPIELIEEG